VDARGAIRLLGEMFTLVTPDALASPVIVRKLRSGRIADPADERHGSETWFAQHMATFRE
jgi:hypothetical protein